MYLIKHGDLPISQMYAPVKLSKDERPLPNDHSQCIWGYSSFNLLQLPRLYIKHKPPNILFDLVPHQRILLQKSNALLDIIIQTPSNLPERHPINLLFVVWRTLPESLFNNLVSKMCGAAIYEHLVSPRTTRTTDPPARRETTKKRTCMLNNDTLSELHQRVNAQNMFQQELRIPSCVAQNDCLAGLETEDVLWNASGVRTGD